MINPPVLPDWDLEAFSTGGLTQKVLIAAVQGARRYCGWHVTPQALETVVLDGDGGRLLQLPSLNVAEVLKVSVRGTTLDAAVYEWSADGTIRRVNNSWPDGFRCIEVEFVHGFVDAEDFVSAVMSSAVTAGMSPGGVAEKVGPFSFEGGGGQMFTTDQRNILDRYRLPAHG